MATYSREDFEQIAAAIRCDVSDVWRYERQFEAAAMWYRLGRNALKIHRTTPSVMSKRMEQIATNEDAVVRATARIGRLVEILEAVDATREIKRRAEIGPEDVVRVGEMVVPKGHHGETAVNDWIAAMMSIYKQITGKEPGISVAVPGRPDRGKAYGPLIRFLGAVGRPLGIQLSPESFAGRIRDIRTGGRRRQK